MRVGHVVGLIVGVDGVLVGLNEGFGGWAEEAEARFEDGCGAGNLLVAGAVGGSIPGLDGLPDTAGPLHALPCDGRGGFSSS